MNTRVSMVRRDMAAACALTLAVAAFLFIWSPSLQPFLSPPRPAPPAITYCPAALTADERQEHYDQWHAAHSPALIALSSAMMLPPVKRGRADAVAPPLDTPARLLRFPDTLPTERNDDRIPMLTPSRPMTALALRQASMPAPAGAPTPSQN